MKEETVATRSIICANRRERELETLTVADPAADQVQIENLVEANREWKETVHTLQKYPFNFFEKLVSPALAVKWQLIMKEEIGGVDYVSLTGTKPGLIRAMDFSSLSPCYFCFVKLVAPFNAAEWLRRYMTTTMVLNTDKGITIEMGVARVIEMNEALPYLPCLKHKEGAPATMSAMNIKYTEIELCSIVLNAVHLTVSTAYYAAVQNEFPTDITRLTAQLTRVCDQNKEHKRLLNDLASIVGLKTKDGAGNRGSMNSSTEAIPRKPKDRKRGGGTPAAAPSSATRGGNINNDARGGGCVLCKKYNTRNPNTWKIHHERLQEV